jgi:hypothetical protein
MLFELAGGAAVIASRAVQSGVDRFSGSAAP